MDIIKLKRKIFNALKLSGFNVRIEFCALIIESFSKANVDLKEKVTFDSCIKNLCTSLEKQCIHDKSIEREHVQQAIDVCLHLKCDKNETVFNIIGAFNFPRLYYNPERNQYYASAKKPTLLSKAVTKAELFVERYATILQRTRRNFKNKILNDDEKLELQTVDYLLTSSKRTLDKTLILGSLLLVSEGKYCLEDPTGIVALDLTHAKFQGGLFIENSFVLVNGFYEDKKLTVSTVILPPGEEYKHSKLTFSNVNYFGGESNTALRESKTLAQYLHHNPHGMILFFSDLWLDYPGVFEKLEILFNGVNPDPPVAFIFMGNFTMRSNDTDEIETLKKLFKEFGELVGKFPGLAENSKFVFVPGMLDPCMPHIVPRFSIPKYISSEFMKNVPKAIFTTNPARLQYCNKEIVLFRADILVKLMQGTLYKPAKEEIAECITRTIVSQGHLSPVSLNALTTHWDYDYSLRLYPLPNLVVIGDKSESYQGVYKGCQVVNPGPFCDSGFQFKSYTPFTDEIDDCVL